jgi:hypothetical protein
MGHRAFCAAALVLLSAAAVVSAPLPGRYYELLEAGAGGDARFDLPPETIDAWIRHHGWTMYVDPLARLVWPVHPYNPSSNAPEEGLDHAAAALSVPIRLQAKPGHPVRPNEQEILFRLTTE